MGKLNIIIPATLLLLLMVLSMAACTNTKERANPPNFLFIFTDDQGYDDLSHHGNQYLETPHIDALADESVEFTNFHAAPLCAPSRACLLTGRQFLRTGVWGVHRGHDYLNPDETTFAEVLQQNGYTTGMMGKWHSGHPDAWKPWNRGFDHAWTAKLYQHGDCRLTYNGEEQHRGGWATDTLTEIAIQFMEEHKDQPFFCYLPYMAPHGQWRAPENYINKYREKGLSEELAVVNAMIDHIDVNVGRLLDYLEKSGLAENTIEIYTTDNGPVQQTHGAPPNQMTDDAWQKRNPSKLKGSKGTVWENGTRVPFFVRWQGRYAPSVVDKNAHLIDMFPTILDLAGIKIPTDNKPVDGVSLRPLFEGRMAEWSDRLIFGPKDEPYWPGRESRNDVLPSKSVITYENQVLTARTQDFKLVKHKDGYHLYNLPNDPREEVDVIGECPEIAEQMKKELKRWYEEILASPSSYTHPRFLIGEEKIDSTFIYACATASASGNVKGGSHSTSNWLEKGDAQTILVKVLQTGTYHLTLDARVMNPTGTVQVSVGNRYKAVDLEDIQRGSRQVELGEMELAEGDYDLEIRITEGLRSGEPIFREVKGITIKKRTIQ